MSNKFVLVPMRNVTEPFKEGTYRLYTDRYWICTGKNELLFYRGFAPQCNRTETITSKVFDKMKADPNYPGKKIVYLKKAFVEVVS